jgi:hypothetical protein
MRTMVRVIDAFVDKLDLSRLGFEGVAPEATGRRQTLASSEALGGVAETDR